jgi:hypothetical protein
MAGARRRRLPVWGTGASIALMTVLGVAGLNPETAHASAASGANTITLSSSSGSVGTVIEESGQSDPHCTGAPTLTFGPVPFQLASSSRLTIFPPTAANSWSIQFAVPPFLPSVGTPGGMAVSPGSYEFIIGCNGEPSESAAFTVTSNVVPSRFVAMAATPSGGGYWLTQAGGGVYSFGDAVFYGSMPGLGIAPTSPIVGMAATPDGNGYWLVAADGGVFSFGDARFFGSLPGLRITPAAPIVGIAAMSDGSGYWLLGADGGVFAFGDAPFYGAANAAADAVFVPYSSIAANPGGAPQVGYTISSEYQDFSTSFTSTGVSESPIGPSVSVNSPTPLVASTAASPEGGAVWLAQSNGGVFTANAGNGTPLFFGSLPGLNVTPSAPITGIASTSDHHGYWLLGADGGVFAFGDASFKGSAGSSGFPW